MSMITKAEIQRKNGNKYYVRIPLFEWSGEKQKFEEWATVCYMPGAFPTYKRGDIVFVSFENNDIGKPVILGKLYRKNEKLEDDSVTLYGSNLIVKNKVELPADIKIENLSITSITSLNYILNNYKILEEKVKKLEEEINN